MLLQECSIIPDWLKDNLDKKCPYCGSEYHIGLSPNGTRVTKHYCPNRYCPGTVAMKMVFVWNILGVTGIKFGRSMELIRTHDIKNHMSAIPLVVAEKPRVSISTFMRMNCIQNIDNAWSSICEKRETVEGVLNAPEVIGLITEDDKKDILDSIQYVDIIQKERNEYAPVFSATIMMTGDIMNLPNREYFVIALNKRYKGLLDLRYSPSKRKTGIFALVKEEHSAITGKVSIAKECNIPIMTPKEFIVKINQIIIERAKDKYDVTWLY